MVAKARLIGESGTTSLRHPLRQRHGLPRLGHPAVHRADQGGQAADRHRPGHDPLHDVDRRTPWTWSSTRSSTAARATSSSRRRRPRRSRPWPRRSRGSSRPERRIKVIGTRHGEKLYETLLTREEMARAEDLGDYYRVPADNRDLNYDLYFTEGEERVSKESDYNSHNTRRLERRRDGGACSSSSTIVQRALEEGRR